MADVMPGRGHGGDGAEDPPPPGGFGRGHHESDFDAPRKTRGKAKNKKLTNAVSLSGRPLNIPFDVNVTFTLIGELNDWFTREVGIYMWEHIAFDKTSWKYVSSAEKNAFYEHLKLSFDLDEIERGCESAPKKGGIEATLLKRYRDRKAMAKKRFINNGGYADEERARANPPEGNKSRLDAFYNTHTGKHGTFDSEIAERHYNDLKAEFQNQIGPNSDGEFNEESNASHPNQVAVFEKVMGVRRGHTRGIGHKPSKSDGSSSFVGHQEQQMRPSGHTQDQTAGTSSITPLLPENVKTRSSFCQQLRQSRRFRSKLRETITDFFKETRKQ
ncbi:hypothetical protein R6Q57_006800 [Mikania cordata]